MFDSLRRFAFPLRLVAARLRARRRATRCSSPLGVVAGAAVLAAVLAGRLVMQDRALAQATAAARAGRPPGGGGVERRRRTTSRGSNRFVAPRVQAITGHGPAAAMLFREASIQQRLVNLRAADDLGRYVRLVSGRLPQPCRPSHCEVLRLAGRGADPVDASTCS